MTPLAGAIHECPLNAKEKQGKEKLEPKAMWREIAGANGTHELREPTAAYEAVFDAKNEDLRQKNTFFWEISI
jgi:hypothetical protein